MGIDFIAFGMMCHERKRCTHSVPILFKKISAVVSTQVLASLLDDTKVGAMAKVEGKEV
jgi:hypothetical protein